MNWKKVLEMLENEKENTLSLIDRDEYLKSIVSKYSNQCEGCLEDLNKND